MLNCLNWTECMRVCGVHNVIRWQMNTKAKALDLSQMHHCSLCGTLGLY